MGLNNNNARPVVFDLETAPIPGAEAFLEEPSAPSNYKDPEKIRLYIDEAKRGLLDTCALDPDLARIVALGFEVAGEVPTVLMPTTEDEERTALQHFWDCVAEGHLIGFNCLSFDLQVLSRRALYLEVPVPAIALDRYKHPRVTDLLDVLSFGSIQRRHSLMFYCKRFGITVPDPLEQGGAEVGKAVREGRLDDVQRHCFADVCRTSRLAHRLGVFPVPFVTRTGL